MSNTEKKSSKKGLIALIVLVIIGGIGYVIGKPYYDLHFGKINSFSEAKTIYVPSNSNLDSVAAIVDENSILDKTAFLSYSEKLDFNDEKVEPGKYVIEPGTKIKNLIYALKNGNQEVLDVRITFNNCKSLNDIAGKVSLNIEADSSEISQYLNDPKTQEKYGFSPETFIAMFLPDTYEVGEWDMSAEEFTQKMADEFKKFWNEDRTAKRKDLNLTESEITTLASIVEAEQGIFQQEWKTIAGLYLNRVRKGMKLEADPTFKFCWGDELKGVQRLLQKHREIDCPYNTYLYAGIPPGPICNPSKTAIDAVLNAERHDYIFFCARPDNSGLHNFAETYSQHLENARKFWKYMDSKNL